MRTSFLNRHIAEKGLVSVVARKEQAPVTVRRWTLFLRTRSLRLHEPALIKPLALICLHMALLHKFRAAVPPNPSQSVYCIYPLEVSKPPVIVEIKSEDRSQDGCYGTGRELFEHEGFSL